MHHRKTTAYITSPRRYKWEMINEYILSPKGKYRLNNNNFYVDDGRSKPSVDRAGPHEQP